MNKHKIIVLSCIVVTLGAVVTAAILLYNWSNYIDVNSSPSGATVKVDGIYKGTTPCTIKWLRNGTHSLDINKSGYDSYHTNMVLHGLDSFHFYEELVKYADISPATGRSYGHEWVDLGLSVKWARCDIKADTPQENGHPFAWGEVRTKSQYTTANSKTYGYGHKGYYNLDIRGDASLDAARANWGGGWRLPSKDECQELIENCEWERSIAITWNPYRKMYGYTVTSKKNGNSIFLPYSHDGLFETWSYCAYWTSTSGSDSDHAYSLSVSGDPDVDETARYVGLKIRPVTK